MTIEKKFWNRKYAEGGISGRGSIGKYRTWKWAKIRDVIGNFREVIDVGCGDLKFWEHPIANKILNQRRFKYLGIDISDEIITRNRKFAPGLKFICAPSHKPIPGEAEVVLALDLLFHIMDHGNFEETLQQLCKASKLWIVIYSWQKNPFEKDYTVTDGKSQYFRKLSEYTHVFDENDFRLKDFYRVPYDPFGVLYFMKRVIY